MGEKAELDVTDTVNRRFIMYVVLRDCPHFILFVYCLAHLSSCVGPM